MKSANIFNQKASNDFRVEYCLNGKTVSKQSFRLFEDAQQAVNAWNNGKPRGSFI